MDNQHRKVTGYRDFTQEELALINRIKAKAEEVGTLVAELEHASIPMNVPADDAADAVQTVINMPADKRWLAIGRTHLQEGFMALARSVAKPTTF